MGSDIRLVNLGPIAFFREFKLTTVSGNFSESTDHTHVVSLMYRLIIPSLSQEDNSISPKNDRT